MQQNANFLIHSRTIKRAIKTQKSTSSEVSPSHPLGNSGQSQNFATQKINDPYPPAIHPTHGNRA